MTNKTPLDRGDYTIIDVANPMPVISGNPLAKAHEAMVRELSRVVVPRIDVSPVPEQMEDVADYIERTARMFDRWLLKVGEELQSNATVNIDMSVFTDQFLGAVQGNATHECDREAEALREDFQEAGRRYDRSRGAWFQARR